MRVDWLDEVTCVEFPQRLQTHIASWFWLFDSGSYFTSSFWCFLELRRSRIASSICAMIVEFGAYTLKLLGMAV